MALESAQTMIIAMYFPSIILFGDGHSAMVSKMPTLRETSAFEDNASPHAPLMRGVCVGRYRSECAYRRSRCRRAPRCSSSTGCRCVGSAVMGENTFGGPAILDCCTAKRAPVQPKLPHSRPPIATLRSRLSRQQHAPSIALRTTDDPGSIPLSLTTIKRAEAGCAFASRGSSRGVFKSW
jgi:hypothetical protein